MNSITSPQMTSSNDSRADERVALYNAIRERISQSFFSRTKIDEEELLHVIFMKLIDRFLPGPDSDEMKELLDQEIRHTIRDFKLDKRPMLDIERVNPDDGPSYEEQSWTEEAEFERAFERFCNQCEEPKSSVYLRSRTHSKKQLSRIYGIHEKRIYKMLDKMADEFDDFLKKFRE